MSGDRLRLVVLFGGRSAEHDVSCITARHVMAAVDPDRYDIVAVGIDRDGNWSLADDAMAALAEGPQALPDQLSPAGTSVSPSQVVGAIEPTEKMVVLPLLHGPNGEDGTVQGLLELADVPFVGSSVLSSALAMDKVKAKEVLSFHGIAQAKWRSLQAGRFTEADLASIGDELGYPLFVKPANMGSSIGVSRVENPAQLDSAVELALSYDEWVVLEEGISGREIEVAVLGNQSLRVSVPGEVRPGATFYSYEDKYFDDNAEYSIPASLTGDVKDRIREMAMESYRALRCEGLARVDFFYEEDGRGLLLNEINTIPGFTPISMYPKLWEASGLGYAELIDELVRLALERHARRAKLR